MSLPNNRDSSGLNEQSPRHDQDSTKIPHDPPFQIHESLKPYCLPRSHFINLPQNANKDIIVGAAIIRPCKSAHSLNPASPSTTYPDPTPHSAEILLIQRSSTETSFPDHWELPGGHVELSTDQTILESVVRKIREETGLIVCGIPGRFEGFEYESKGGGRLPRQYNFVVDVEGGNVNEQGGEEVILNEKEHQGYKWVDRADLRVQGGCERGGGVEMTAVMRDCVKNGLKAVEAILAKRRAGRDTQKP